MAKGDEVGISVGLAAFAAATLLASARERRSVAGRPPVRSLPASRTDANSKSNANGSGATDPLEIPARGWWAILKRVAGDIGDNRLMTEAAGMTFYALLSLFPAIAALVSLYGLFADPTTVSHDLNAVSGFVPGGGMDILQEQVKRVTSNGSGALGFGVVVGLLTSLWSSNQGMKALVDSLNSVYGEREKRGFVRRTLLTLGFTIGGLIFVMIAMATVVVLPIVLGFVGLSGETDLLLRLARWPILLIVITVLLAIIYRYGPSRHRARWTWVSWGSAFAALGWAAVSLAFSWYVANFGSYNKTYGSLGAVVGFMTWIWISGLVVLIGAQLDAEMEKQTARDTTTGPDLPRGSRGAVMADSVAD